MYLQITLGFREGKVGEEAKKCNSKFSIILKSKLLILYKSIGLYRNL